MVLRCRCFAKPLLLNASRVKFWSRCGNKDRSKWVQTHPKRYKVQVAEKHSNNKSYATLCNSLPTRPNQLFCSLKAESTGSSSVRATSLHSIFGRPHSLPFVFCEAELQAPCPDGSRRSSNGARTLFRHLRVSRPSSSLASG